MQRFGFAFPVSLTVPMTIITIFVFSILREAETCALHGFIPDYLFYSLPYKHTGSVTQLFDNWKQWLWIPWLLSQAWITMHIWTPHCERLASADRLFAVPSYDSLILDQSLMLNRRKDDAPDDDDDESVNLNSSVEYSSTIKPSDRVTKIYAHATW